MDDSSKIMFAQTVPDLFTTHNNRQVAFYLNYATTFTASEQKNKLFLEYVSFFNYLVIYSSKKNYITTNKQMHIRFLV